MVMFLLFACCCYERGRVSLKDTAVVEALQPTADAKGARCPASFCVQCRLNNTKEAVIQNERRSTACYVVWKRDSAVLYNSYPLFAAKEPCPRSDPFFVR